MKILIIIQCANLGGMEQVTCHAAGLLRDGGHQVHIVSLHPLNGMEIICAGNGIPISCLKHRPAWGGLLCVGELLREIRRFSPDRIWCVGHNLGSVIAGRLSGTPTCLSIHYHHAEAPMWKWRIIYAVSKICCRRLHFVSHFIFHEVEHLFPRQEKYCIFPNYLPPPPPVRRNEASLRRLALPPDGVVVGNAGWLIPRKAFDIFLQTAKKIMEVRKDVFFLIAGSGPEEENLKRLAMELGIADHVIFAGWLSEMTDFWNSIDLLLFNTRFDAVPTSPLEAALRNIPVVCSFENSGIAEMFEDPRGEFLFAGHDPRQLAGAVLRILSRSRPQREEAAARLRDSVMRKCSAEIYSRRIAAFLDLPPLQYQPVQPSNPDKVEEML